MGFKIWTLTDRQLCDCEMILDNSFFPLDQFMNENDYQSVLNGENRKESWTGSGFYNGHKCNPSQQGGSSYVDSAHESEIRQNTKIPTKGDFNVPFIEIKLLK